MENKYIYLAGSMQNVSFLQSNTWRVMAEEWFDNIDTDYKIICCNPNNYYNFLDSSTYDSDLEVMEFDLHKIRNSDLVLVNLSDPSTGTAMELMLAHELRIPVVGFNESGRVLHPWEIACSNKIFNNQDLALNYIKNYYLN